MAPYFLLDLFSPGFWFWILEMASRKCRLPFIQIQSVSSWQKSRPFPYPVSASLGWRNEDGCLSVFFQFPLSTYCCWCLCCFCRRGLEKRADARRQCREVLEISASVVRSVVRSFVGSGSLSVCLFVELNVGLEKLKPYDQGIKEEEEKKGKKRPFWVELSFLISFYRQPKPKGKVGHTVDRSPTKTDRKSRVSFFFVFSFLVLRFSFHILRSLNPFQSLDYLILNVDSINRLLSLILFLDVFLLYFFDSNCSMAPLSLFVRNGCKLNRFDRRSGTVPWFPVGWNASRIGHGLFDPTSALDFLVVRIVPMRLVAFRRLISLFLLGYCSVLLNVFSIYSTLM